MHQDLPAYLLNWKIAPNIHNHNTRCTTDIGLYSFRTKHEFAKRCLRYNLPHVINNTPKIMTEKIGTHRLRVLQIMEKIIYYKNMKKRVQY